MYSNRTCCVQSLCLIWPFVTPRTVAHQAPLSSTTSGVCSNSCPLSWWCYLTISSSASPFSFCLQSFAAPVCMPGKSQGQRSLEGYGPWGCKSQTQLIHQPLSHFPSIRVFSNASALKEFKELEQISASGDRNIIECYSAFSHIITLVLLLITAIATSHVV